MVYMKRSLIVLLISALLIACFASCSPNDSALENISDSESETELQIESVSETETESVSETESESESETETEEELEKVYLPQQDIPGERLSYDVIYVERFRIGSKDQKVFRFETEAELEMLLHSNTASAPAQLETPAEATFKSLLKKGAAQALTVGLTIAAAILIGALILFAAWS